MRERELASLLIQTGLERGADLDEIVGELASTPLPSFIDGDAFREALLRGIEDYLQRQVARRVEQFRLQLRATPATSEPVEAGADRSPPAPAATSETVFEPHEPGDTPGDAAASGPAELPTDATIIWMVDDEQESEPDATEHPPA